MEDNKKNESNDIFLFIILVPLGISLFSWISIGVEQFALYMNSLMQKNVVTLKLLDFLTSLFPTSDSDFAFWIKETKVMITFLAMSIIIFPISTLFYLLVKFIKKIKTNERKE